MFSTTDILLYVPILTLISLVLAVYTWCKHQSTYWQRQNILHIPGLPLFGNFKRLVTQSKSPPALFQEYYNESTVKDAAFCGINMFYKPAILVRDPELIRRVLVKDFNSFSDR